MGHIINAAMAASVLAVGSLPSLDGDKVSNGDVPPLPVHVSAVESEEKTEQQADTNIKVEVEEEYKEEVKREREVKVEQEYKKEDKAKVKVAEVKAVPAEAPLPVAQAQRPVPAQAPPTSGRGAEVPLVASGPVAAGSGSSAHSPQGGLLIGSAGLILMAVAIMLTRRRLPLQE
jgi:hypothetical protein